jgi:hypothetical protein
VEIVKIYFFDYEKLNSATVEPFLYKVTSGTQAVLHGLRFNITAVFFGNVNSAVREGLQLLYYLCDKRYRNEASR